MYQFVVYKIFIIIDMSEDFNSDILIEKKAIPQNFYCKSTFTVNQFDRSKI